VINGIAQVAALEQALLSSQSALDSTRLGYGGRASTSMLNAAAAFLHRRDLPGPANTINSHLRLKLPPGPGRMT
jgi:outer membrane protein